MATISRILSNPCHGTDHRTWQHLAKAATGKLQRRSVVVLLRDPSHLIQRGVRTAQPKPGYTSDDLLRSFPSNFSVRHYHDSTQHTVDTNGAASPTLEMLHRIQEAVRQQHSAVSLDRRRSTFAALDPALAANFCQAYLQLPAIHSKAQCQRLEILEYLALDCALKEPQVAAAVANYTRVADSNDPALRVSQTFTRLRQATTPIYEDIFKALLETSTSDTLHFLMQSRADLKKYISYLQQHSHKKQEQQTSKQQTPKQQLQSLKSLEEDLRQVLAPWFSPSLLTLERITYETTPTSVMERIVRREAVHPVQNLADLRQRLGSSRRVFALFHPLLTNTPLVVVHISLQTFIPSTMVQIQQQATHKNPTAAPTVAAFYSISNMEAGLAGTGLGEYLLKQAKAALSREFPTSLQTFVTLSPIPGFQEWLWQHLQPNHEDGRKFQDCVVSKIIAESFLQENENNNSNRDTDEDASTAQPIPALREYLLAITQQKDGPLSPIDNDPEHAKLAQCLLRLVARYIVHEKHRGDPLDPVARFHIGNGAALYRINWNANRWRSNYGIMVNYHYRTTNTTSAADELEHDDNDSYSLVSNVMIHDNVKALL